MADTPLSLDDIFDQAQAQVTSSAPPDASAPPNVPPVSAPPPTAPTPPAATFGAPPVSAPPAPRRDVLEYLHKQGMDVSGFQSDDDWYDACERHEAEIARERQSLEEYYRNRDQYLTWQQQGQSQPSAVTPPAQAPGQPAVQEPQPTAFSVPAPSELALDFAQKGYIAIDPKTGRYRAVDPTLAPLEKQLNDYSDWQRQQARKIVTKPEEWFKESGLADKFKPKEVNEDELFQKFEQRFIEKQQKVQLESQYLQVEPLLFQMNPQGEPQRNAAGDFIPTDLGRQFKDTVATLANQGITDNYQRLRIALSLMGPQLSQAYQQRLNPPVQPPALAAPPAAAPQAPPVLSPAQVRDVKQGQWLNDTTARTDSRLSAEDARIYEAVHAGLDKQTQKGSKRLGDLYDEAQALALNSAR